jgi:hypothetical protein
VGARGVSVELADTSAWTNLHHDDGVAADFEQLVRDRMVATCAPVRLELLNTARDAEELADILEELAELPQIAVGDREWRRAEDVLFELARRGPLHHRQVRLPDLLVAAAAERAEIPVLHYDRHFELIASITGQPVRALAPLGSL